MVEQNQIEFVLNHQFFVPGAFLAVFLLLLVAFKFLLGFRTPNVAQSLEDAGKSSGRKKKSKKQKTTAERKGPDSPKPKKDTRKSEMESSYEIKKRIIEDEKSDKKKDGKSKAKSKKKKSSNSQVKVETIPHPTAGDINLEAGEWKTISTKEQREQIKREKRKLEENTFLPVTTIVKNDPMFIPPLYKPTPNISAIAKGIAPRFARAAGEQWQEPSSTSYPSKRPMPPATVPGAKLQSSTSKPRTTVNQQPWSPSQGRQLLPGELGSTWSSPPIATGANNLTNDLMGMTWEHGDTATLLSMATSGDKAPVSGWPQGGNTWQSPGSRTTWDVSNEDWVHVNGQNGRNANSNAKTLFGREGQIRTRAGSDKHEEWTLEPEGFPIQTPQMGPDDPWNFEVVGNDDAGDWAAPAASWDNTNAEWTAPVVVKSKPTYEDECVSPSKVAPTHPILSAPSLPPQPVVGAGPDFLTQAASGQGKKSRRRRKKKQAVAGEPEQPSTPEMETPKTEIAEERPKIETPTLEVKESAPEVSDDWTIPKISKKRKNKARKAD